MTDPGQRVLAGRYRLERRIARGGMGTLWEGYDQVLGRPVAVKEVDGRVAAGEDPDAVRERVLVEARAAARISHPAAVTVHDVVEADGKPWIVMELVRAATLADEVRRRGPFAVGEVARIGVELAEALGAAHLAKVVHRDVKPGNVMLLPDGRVKLADFGIASTTDQATTSSDALLLGTPPYIAPERAEGVEPGRPSDLWSLGATLWYAVEGTSVFDRGDPQATMGAVVHDPLPRPHRAGPLAPVLAELLSKRPGDRPSTTRVRARLEPLAVAPHRGGAFPGTADTQVIARAVVAARAVPPAALGRMASQPPPLHAHPAPVPQRHPVAYSAGYAGLPPATGGRQRARRRRRTGLVLAVVALLLLAAGGATAGVLLGRGGGGSATTARTAAIPLPSGWRVYTDPIGMRVAVPAGWQTRRHDGVTDLQDPQTGTYLRVDTRGGAGTDPVQGWKAFAPVFAKRYPTYAEKRIEKANVAFGAAADWEFTFTDGSTPLHDIDRNWVVDGRSYALDLQSAERQWGQVQQLFDPMMRTFRPPATTR